MRGRFSYSVASLSWFERKAAAALFSAPPEATYDDAIRVKILGFFPNFSWIFSIFFQDFAAVEKIQPMWLENLLFLAKAYLAKGNKAAAVARLEKAVKGGNDEDSEPMQEARELLKKHRKWVSDRRTEARTLDIKDQPTTTLLGSWSKTGFLCPAENGI